ncbi:hypothetical protein E8E13_006012 [Curvularia kusanoi]|uniref:Uncharacterized protein n=1 Tax=Curvularia kusanoi TaxID=90978 RepID=A0A9P4THA1_CURKU|nr:hypothetical protein E8E13_006012 [Curvularia kusanoi]
MRNIPTSMAMNGDTESEQLDGNLLMHTSFDSWVSKYGRDAYKDFTKDHPKTDLSYEAWRQTDRVYGGYLYHVVSLVWNEDEESDEETPKRRRISRVSGENSKKAATSGTGAARTAGTTTPNTATNIDETITSGKRKRKPRKKYMSQELVASDEEPVEEDDAATPKAELTVSATPEVTLNGRRKSATRRPRKKPISDEKISPEDEDDDPMELDAPVVASPLPVRPAPRVESPKTATPKQASVKKPRKSLLVRLSFRLWDAVNLDEKSEKTILEEDTDTVDVSIAEVSRPATTPAAKIKPNVNNDVENDDEAAAIATVEGTPDTSARRGLRNRKPAQRRPYYHDAQVFEDVETEPDDDSELGQLSRLQSLEPPPSKPKHFKGKGRAWKKEGSDEDEEFVTPKEKKAAKAAKVKADKEKAKAGNGEVDGPDLYTALMDHLEGGTILTDILFKDSQRDQGKKANGASQEQPKQKKKLGRPRKSNLSETIVRENSDNDTPQSTPTQPPKRGRGRPRKSALSSELVRDDSDEETPAIAEQQASVGPIPNVLESFSIVNLVTPTKSKTSSRPSTATSAAPASTPKKRGRPRKSEASTSTTPSQSITKAEQDSNTPKPQQQSSTAIETTEPKPMRTRTSVSSVPDVAPTEKAPATTTATPAPTTEKEYALPTVNRGAALVESQSPRDEPRANSTSTPVPATVPTESAPESTPVAAEAQILSPAVDEAANEVPGVSQSKAPSPVSRTFEPEDKNAVVAESPPVQQAEEAEEGELSAAMSLSSDSEL